MQCHKLHFFQWNKYVAKSYFFNSIELNANIRLKIFWNMLLKSEIEINIFESNISDEYIVTDEYIKPSWIYSPRWLYPRLVSKRLFLPLCKVGETTFQLQWGDVHPTDSPMHLYLRDQKLNQVVFNWVIIVYDCISNYNNSGYRVYN